MVVPRRARPTALAAKLVTVTAALAAALVLGPIDRSAATAAQEAAGELPVLWSGTLTDTAGRPAAGRVVAFVRPPASAIPKVNPLTPVSRLTPIPSIPLGESSTGPDGRFEIRAVPSPDIPPSYHKPDGALDVMVLAQVDGGGWTVASDTVQFLDAPGVGRAWFTSPERYEEAAAAGAGTSGSDGDASLSSLSALATADAVQAAGADRPSVLRANLAGEPMPAQGDAATSAVPPGGYVACNALGTYATGKAWRTVDQVDAVTYWDMWATYGNMKGTSWALGVSVTGTSGWTVGGSSNFSQSQGVEVVYHAYSGPYSPYRQKFQMEANHSKIRWQCGGKTGSPPPGTGGYLVYTAEATGVTWGTRNDFGTAIGCNSAYQLLVGGGNSLNRYANSTSTFTGSASIWGFSGNATVQYGSYSAHSWKNDSVYNRYLCGESGSPATGHTRVRAGS